MLVRLLRDLAYTDRSPEDPCYDFFYLPIDFKNRCNLGYAFVNFLDVAGTVECYKHFHSKRWEEFNSRKVHFFPSRLYSTCMALNQVFILFDVFSYKDSQNEMN